MGSDDDVDRVIMWRKAHIPKDGSVNETLRPVLEKIVSIYAYFVFPFYV